MWLLLIFSYVQCTYEIFCASTNNYFLRVWNALFSASEFHKVMFLMRKFNFKVKVGHEFSMLRKIRTRRKDVLIIWFKVIPLMLNGLDLTTVKQFINESYSYVLF